MENIILKIEGINSDKTLEEEIIHVLTAKNIEHISGKRFNGIEEINYILSIGGGIIISQIASIIKKCIDRNRNKSIKINDIEISGYSEKEVNSILQKLLKHD